MLTQKEKTVRRDKPNVRNVEEVGRGDEGRRTGGGKRKQIDKQAKENIFVKSETNV